jgi:hypothetical protein
MPLHYEDEIVIWTYHFARTDDADPTEQEVRDWDVNLFDTYEEALKAELPAHGIALTRHNKSRIVLLAEGSTGQRATTRVRKACEFFVNATALDLDET